MTLTNTGREREVGAKVLPTRVGVTVYRVAAVGLGARFLKEYVPSAAVVVVAEAGPDKVIVTPAKGAAVVPLSTVPDHVYVAGVDELEPAPQPASANTAKDANNKLNILYMIAFIF